MKHILCFLVTILLLVYSGMVFSAKKVTICHIPPGNPANAHTIIVSRHAVPAHMAHGDTLGECYSGGPSSSYSSSSSSLSSSSPVTFTGASFVICDDREDETGRNVTVNLVGRISTIRVECD